MGWWSTVEARVPQREPDDPLLDATNLRLLAELQADGRCSLAELGRRGLLLLCGDSTNADRPGISESESIVGPHLERVFSHCEGRIVVTSFASNIHRVQQVVDAAAVLGRKVSLVGRSMRKNVNIARNLGYMDVPEGVIVAAAGYRARHRSPSSPRRARSSTPAAVRPRSAHQPLRRGRRSPPPRRSDSARAPRRLGRAA